LRIAYLGTTPFAVAVLRRIADSPHRPVLVITPPDRPRGRGRRLASPPVADAARALALDVHQTESVNRDSTGDAVRTAGADLGVVCAFGQLIADPLLTELEMLNVHPSLVPRWRGAAPIERAIMAGDPETGVSIMRVTAGLDSGPVALRERLEIAAGDDYGTLSERLWKLAGDLALRALDLRKAGSLELTEQDDSRATYADKISREDRRLDPARTAIDLERTVRALNPHIGAFLELDGGGPLRVRSARAVPGSDLEPGRLAATGGALALGCAEGELRLQLVQPPGGRAMPADAYLRGHAIPSLAE
jgi:methionyl-tRNA formyltransferase